MRRKITFSLRKASLKQRSAKEMKHEVKVTELHELYRKFITLS